MASSSAKPHAVRVETAGPGETEACGARLAAILAPGDVVLLSGELGTGKTTFVRGACRALGIDGPVTSPTFTIGNRYPGGPWPISHLDLYRLASLDAEDPGLLADYLGPDRVAFVEWPGRDAAAFEAGRLVRVSLQHLGGDRRRIELDVGEPTAAQP